ncbi:BgTH12-07293 [Blumeria graminis f. sp. triticale]|uniref:BgTH12-07293 n=1 Tax=Blumeria graminis f. sp. triticale TaxID=1689686 RepID=A0A9W4D9R2_BLUGR|nr:BgTH12-07293 [Blumeria graminis f. sp. triticale]
MNNLNTMRAMDEMPTYMTEGEKNPFLGKGLKRSPLPSSMTKSSEHRELEGNKNRAEGSGEFDPLSTGIAHREVGIDIFEIQTEEQTKIQDQQNSLEARSPDLIGEDPEVYDRPSALLSYSKSTDQNLRQKAPSLESAKKRYRLTLTDRESPTPVDSSTERATVSGVERRNSENKIREVEFAEEFPTQISFLKFKAPEDASSEKTMCPPVSGESALPALSTFPNQNNPQEDWLNMNDPMVLKMQRKHHNAAKSYTQLDDSIIAKKKKRDLLRRELKQLHADIDLAQAENKRIKNQELPVIGESSTHQQKIFAMLLRATTTEKEERSISTESIFSNINSFLPFNSRRPLVPRVYAQETIPIKRGPSHSPLPLENPLTYLQAFTPLTWSSTIAVIDADESALSDAMIANVDEKFIRHIITASHPQGIFSARLAIIVGSKSQTVSRISLLHLPLPAEYELGSFLIRAGLEKETDVQGSITRELGVVCYAMGRWLEVSIRRARFWWLVLIRYSTAEARKKWTSGPSRAQARRRAEGSDEAWDVDEATDAIGSARWTRKTLLPHLGRTSLCIGRYGSMADPDRRDNSADIEILLEWKLTFDWTGEVQSNLSACARIPESWRDLDIHQAFVQIPDLFRRLLQEKGALAAVAGVLTLTFDNPLGRSQRRFVVRSRKTRVVGFPVACLVAPMVTKSEKPLRERRDSKSGLGSRTPDLMHCMSSCVLEDSDVLCQCRSAALTAQFPPITQWRADFGRSLCQATVNNLTLPLRSFRDEASLLRLRCFSSRCFPSRFLLSRCFPSRCFSSWRFPSRVFS